MFVKQLMSDAEVTRVDLGSWGHCVNYHVSVTRVPCGCEAGHQRGNDPMCPPLHRKVQDVRTSARRLAPAEVCQAISAGGSVPGD